MSFFGSSDFSRQFLYYVFIDNCKKWTRLSIGVIRVFLFTNLWSEISLLAFLAAER